jgi:hypothetical protein
MSAGWIKLHRAIADNPRSSNPEWFTVWIHLLLLATHRPIKMVFGKDVIELKPGQLITSRNSLSKKTGVHRSTVDRILNTLKNEHQIEQASSSVSRLITIIKWADYQMIEPPPEPQASHERATGEPRASTNKNIRTREHKNIRIEVGSDGALPEADQQWLNGLIADAAYRGINIPQEFRKCLNWCNANKKQLSRKRFINWLNRADKPVNLVSMQQDWFRDVKGSSANLEAYR